jgi:formamidopyrimidine-DNA glycosylase
VPELPEVETVRRTLKQLVIGKTIADVMIHWPKIVKLPDDVDIFRTRLKGQTIQDIGRRGKFLKMILDDDVLVSHLRMEGRYELRETPDSDKHTHVIFVFTDRTELHYRDVRKFGTMHLFPKGEEDMSLPLSHLGLEPFDKQFSASYLGKNLAKTKRKIKVALLDQKIVVGLGNIYVDEALFQAGVHPERIADTLSNAEIKRLRQKIKETLQEAVDKGGSTIRTYMNSQGEMGMFQQQLFVYGRQGETCKRCETLIEKRVVGGRGTHFCPSCQK